MTVYDDSQVFIPGRGHVLIGQANAQAPDLTAIKQWIGGDKSSDLAGGYTPIGYTSLDELPAIESDTDGGENIGVWENPALRTTPITESTSVTVTPVQWAPEVLRMRFGAGAEHDENTGWVHVRNSYASLDASLLVLIVEGTRFLAVHFAKVQTSPEGGLELDAEKFAGLPIKFTVLQALDGRRVSIGAEHLKTATIEGDQ